MQPVRPKKRLGQHFLKDENIARKIVASLNYTAGILEVGPGQGMLSKYLITISPDVKLLEIDGEAADYLRANYPDYAEKVIKADFLKYDLLSLFEGDFSVIGNFPYNISSQIFFRIMEYRQHIPEVVGMIQKEVAERLSASHGNKTYGILTVLLGAFYHIEYLFTVSEHVFHPPPKVKSAVIRLTRKTNFFLDCDERLFFNVVKAGFNQRRKTLRNSLRDFWTGSIDPEAYPVFKQRPEQLDLDAFVGLTKLLQKKPG